MTGQTIVCPSCSSKFKLDESLAAPLIAATRKEYEQKIAAKDMLVAQREVHLQAQQAELAKGQAELADQVNARVNAEKARIMADESRKAKLHFADDLAQKDRALAEANELLKAREVKLAEAQKAQASVMKKQRQLDDATRELDVTIEKRVHDSLAEVREKAKLEAEAGLKLKVSEKEEQIASMQKQIEELRRKAEQGSQQLQGEVLEMELENLLRSRFPHDVIEPVAKGSFGGDILQRVITPSGQICGTILWESKRTKNWSDSWLPKLRADQRNAKADIALIITNALPKGVNSFELVDEVWVGDLRCAMPMATLLRHSLIEIAATRKSSEGQQTKMELVYQYLTGPHFKRRLQAITEKFDDLQEDLKRERKFMTNQWAKREQQLLCMQDSTAGMYGDLQGIAGSALGEIESLDVPMIAQHGG